MDTKLYFSLSKKFTHNGFVSNNRTNRMLVKGTMKINIDIFFFESVKDLGLDKVNKKTFIFTSEHNKSFLFLLCVSCKGHSLEGI